MTKDFALNVALEALYNFADDESVDGWKAIDAIGIVRKALEEPPPDQLPDTTQMIDKVCIRHWVQDTIENHLDAVYQRNDQAFLAQAQLGQPDATKWLDEIKGDEPNLLNQTCCGCGKSNCFALYCGWCWGKGDEPVGYVDQSDLDREGHDFWVSRQEGTHTVPLYTAPPKREWVSLTDDDIKEIVGNWGDTPIRGYTRRLFDKIDAMYRKRNQDLNDTNNPF